MRSTCCSFALALAALALLALPGWADDIPLLDGHSLNGRILDVTATGLKVEGEAPGGGTYTMTVSADHIDPHWWYARRDLALGSDVHERLELAVWAVEHGLFRQAKAQFEKARKLDPAAAKEFRDDVVPGMRQGIAAGLVESARRDMDVGKLDAANQMLHAVLNRFADTHAAGDARTLLATLQHRVDAKLVAAAHWKEERADEAARAQATERRAVTDPIVALIRQGNNILAHMPPPAAQADAVASTRQAANEFEKAIQRVEMGLKAHASDPQLVARLDELGRQAQAALVQCHVDAGDVYVSTGNYTGALDEATALSGLTDGADDAAALRARAREAEAWSDDGLAYGARWVAGGAGGRGEGRRR